MNQFLDETIDKLNFSLLFDGESVKFLYSFHELTEENITVMLSLRQKEYAEFMEELFIKKLTDALLASQNLESNEMNRMKSDIIFKSMLYLLPKVDTYGEEEFITVLSQLIDLITIQIQNS